MNHFSSDSAFGRELSFKVTPESFQPVDVISSLVGVFVFAVFHHPMDITLGGDSGVTAPSVGANNRTSFNFLFNDRLQVLGFHIVDQLGEHLTVSAQDAEDRLFSCPSATLGLGRNSPCFKPFVLLLTANIGFINFHYALKDRRHIPSHGETKSEQSFQQFVFGDLYSLQHDIGRVSQRKF